jgi:hypothetical protein
MYRNMNPKFRGDVPRMKMTDPMYMYMWGWLADWVWDALAPNFTKL